MKIAMWHALPSGGARRVLLDQVRGLASRGHELHVWAPTSARDDLAGVAAAHEIPPDIPQLRGGRAELQAAWRGKRVDLEVFAEQSARCAEEIAAIEPDVVLAHTRTDYRPPAIAAFLEHPSVLYLHEPNRRLYEATFDLPWKARRPTRRLPWPGAVRRFVAELVRVEHARIEVRTETEWVRAFDEVLVNSHFTRESTLRAYGRLSTVCSPGVDLRRFPYQDRPPRVRGTVLCVGTLTVEKNPLFLVSAIAAAGTAVRRFVWVANHVDEACWEQVARAAANIGIVFDLLRSVSDDELLRCYADADVFVYAPRLEPFGLAPLEANATGLPVIAVAEGGVRETIVDGVNGVLVEHDADAFGAAVADLLGDDDRTRALGRAAQAWLAEHWSVEASIDRLEARLCAVRDRARPV